MAARQQQFLEVVGLDEARARLRRHLDLRPGAGERVPLGAALQRVLAEDVLAPVDVPGFDRASMDGFALRAADSTGAADAAPCRLRVNAEIVTPGLQPALAVGPGTATVIATGGMLPRGADAVVMVEQTELVGPDADGVYQLELRRPVAPGAAIAAAGGDIARGETVLRAATVLTSREIGMLAAVGLGEVLVHRKPTVAVISTGDELVAPGQPIRPGQVYDSNAAILCAAIEEQGGQPVPLGICPDRLDALSAFLARALAPRHRAAFRRHLQGCRRSRPSGRAATRTAGGHRPRRGPQAGQALVHRRHRRSPGGGPAGLPDLGDLHLPHLRGPDDPCARRPAARRDRNRPGHAGRPHASERGRTEFLMVSLIEADGSLAAYPTAKGSGSVTAFSQADGFIAVPAQTETLAAGSQVEVQLIGRRVRAPDLVLIGSHCLGLDMLIGRLEREGLAVKALNVGSTGGVAAARRGECDLAGVHLLDPATGVYNRHLLKDGTLELVTGYQRLQGLVFRRGDDRFAQAVTAAAALAAALTAPDCLMVNRNTGSGTRILIDQLLAGQQPPGYWAQAKSHNAVAVAVAQGRADWGVAIEPAARAYGLGFLPLQPEHYDFLVPTARRDRPPVVRFIELLAEPAVRSGLAAMGFSV